MADTATTVPASSGTPKKAVKTVKKPRASGGAKKAKTPSNHPVYIQMVSKAIQALKEHKGSSRQAVLKYIMANFNVGGDAKLINSRIKQALKRGVKGGQFKQSKGTGAAGSFRLGEKKIGEAKAKKPKTVKPKKAVTGAATVKPATGEKAKKVRKTKPKSPKKPKAIKAKKPAAAAAKPKKAKSPKKPKAVKPKATKPAAAKKPKTKASPKKKAAGAAKKKAAPAAASA